MTMTENVRFYNNFSRFNPGYIPFCLLKQILCQTYVLFVCKLQMKAV